MIPEFDIKFVRARAPLDQPDTQCGLICIGSLEESFISDLTFWSAADYERHWEAAAARILESERTALITSITDPATSNFIRWWPMYRQGDSVIFREQVLFLQGLPEPFDAGHLEKFVEPRGPIGPDEPISEWLLPLDAIRGFLQRRVRSGG